MSFISSFISTFKRISTSKRKLDGHKIEPTQKRWKSTDHVVVTEDKLEKAQAILTPFGIFGQAPKEVLHKIFSYLTVTQLILLASCSKAYAEEITHFILSIEATQKFHKEVKAIEHNKIDLKFLFCDYGHLLSICGVILPDEKQIELLVTFFCNSKELVENQTGWGLLFRTVTKKWGYAKRLNFFDQLINLELRQLINLVIYANLDELLDDDLLETTMKIRSKLRGYFLDVEFHEPRDAAFWLSAILRLYNQTFEQAKLLLALYAPLHKDELGKSTYVDYRNLSEVDVLSMNDAQERLGPLANVFGKLLPAVELGFKAKMLNEEVDHLGWSKPEVFNLLEEVTTFSEPWPMINFISLLIQTPTLVPIAISYRIIHGFADEAGVILATLNSVALRWAPTSNVLLYHGIKEALKMLSTRQAALLFEKTMHEQLKQIQEIWPFIPDWDPNSVRAMDNAMNSMKELLAMFQVALPLTFIPTLVF